jgi:hypothetical protein
MDQEDIDKVVAELRQKYKEPEYELVPLDLRMGLFVLRNPSHQEFMMYRKQGMDDDQKHLASFNLFAATCVYPDRAELQRAMARWPGLVGSPRVQRALGYLSGTTDDLEGKG